MEGIFLLWFEFIFIMKEIFVLRKDLIMENNIFVMKVIVIVSEGILFLAMNIF